MKKIILFFGLILTVAGLALYLMVQGRLFFSAGSGTYTYALRYELADGDLRKTFLAQIDTGTDKVIKERQVKISYNDLTIDPDDPQRLWVSVPAVRTHLDRAIELYDFWQGRVIRRIKPYGSGPMRILPVGDNLYVPMLGIDKSLGDNEFPDYTHGGFEVYNRNSLKFLGNIDIGKGERLGRFQFDVDKKNNIIYVVTWSVPDLKNEGIGRIFKINAKTNSIEAERSGGNEFASAGGLAIDLGRGLIYIAASYKKPGRSHIPAEHILVFSGRDLSLIKKIPVSSGPDNLLYIPSVDRLYVSYIFHHNYIEAIDCKKQKVVSRILLGNDTLMMSYVGNNKMYVSVLGYQGKKDRNGIAVIDIKTNKVVRFIPGLFTGISANYTLE